MKTKKFLLDKLGRDNVVELFEKQGAKVNYHIVEDDNEFLEALTDKVIEELEEVFSCETKEELLSELADLDDVIETFKKFFKVNQVEIDRLRKEKLERNGGFDKRIYFEYVEAPEGTQAYEYFDKNSDRYPEILGDLEDLEREESEQDED